MHFSSLLLLSAVSASVSASRHVVHEERSVVPPGWMKHSRLDPETVLPVRIGLTQSNLDKADEVLTDVSDDESPNYGNHWSDKRIADFFAPSRHTVSTVRSWLNASGISTKRIQQSSNRGWLHFEATVAEMEELLKTTYWQYEHDTGKAHSSCHQYSVPEHVSKHIDFITPTIHFDAQVPRGDVRKVKRSTTDGTGMSNGPRIGKTVPAPPKNLGNTFVGGSACNQYDFVTPACLRELYNMPRGTKNLSSFGIVEYFPQTYLQSDLNAFQSIMVTNDAGMPVGTTPNTEAIDGGSVLTPDELGPYASDYYAESDLDLQYAMDLVWPQQVTLFQTGDNGTDSEGVISFNNFLDGIDGVYCGTAGGDTPGFDQSFPDANGYNHTEDCGLWAPTSVISTSYGYNEHDLSPAYERRQCNEYMKLGLKGVSFIYSSGDNGVGGNGASCIAPDGSYTDGSSGRFNPLFPGTCPYVTTVGATELAANNTASAPEVACESVIYSGGGFSNVFPMPSYQKHAVNSYFATTPIPYNSSQYNNSRTTRGFPDVSANGANYIIALNGYWSLVYGTSASAPTFGSIITLINNERIAAGRKALGFLNNVLYKYPGMFNDVVEGSNPGCGTEGFSAAVGWDPVTGLGTPNYAKMLKKLKTVAAA